MACTQDKSLFLHRQKEAWDHLIAEVADLQTREAEARHHAKEAEKMVSELSERARKDGEDATQTVRKAMSFISGMPSPTSRFSTSRASSRR
jgi:pyrroloquinoline quinone (PQQ) biosynthesis protein C